MKTSKSPTILEIDHRRFEVTPETIHALQCEQHDDVYILREGNQSYKIKLIDFNLLSGICTLTINGQLKEVKVLREIEVLIERMGLNKSHTKQHQSVQAPMPGLVTNIKVAEGQQIEKGMPLIILEAMKMENVIAAPHDATVKSIHVTIGQAVETGLKLIEFE
jgi:biotin carboxyl carrier protein